MNADAPQSLIANVSDTAFLIAHHRAMESARPDPLFRDPLAALLAGAKGRAIAESSPTAAMTRWLVALRTVVIDDFIREGIADGVDVIVNLGAGLDTRPYRLELPPTLLWVEADLPDRHMVNAPFKFAPADWFAFFAAQGWRPREMRYLPIESERVKRAVPLPGPTRLLMRLLQAVLPANRHPFRHSMGYAMLERGGGLVDVGDRAEGASP